MSITDFKEAKKAVLLAHYEYIMTSNGGEWIAAEEINSYLKEPLPQVYITKVTASLGDEELLGTRLKPNLGRVLYSISEKGILTVQQTLLDEELAGVDLPDEHPEIMLPAAGRLVPISHNAPEYREVDRSLTELQELMRGSNGQDFSEEERSRVIAGLEAARSLWKSLELSYMQIKVGVIIAAEAAANALKSSVQKAASSLLVEAIKAAIRHMTGLNF